MHIEQFRKGVMRVLACNDQARQGLSELIMSASPEDMQEFFAILCEDHIGVADGMHKLAAMVGLGVVLEDLAKDRLETR